MFPFHPGLIQVFPICIAGYRVLWGPIGRPIAWHWTCDATHIQLVHCCLINHNIRCPIAIIVMMHPIGIKVVLYSIRGDIGLGSDWRLNIRGVGSIGMCITAITVISTVGITRLDIYTFTSNNVCLSSLCSQSKNLARIDIGIGISCRNNVVANLHSFKSKSPSWSLNFLPFRKVVKDLLNDMLR